MTTTPHFAPDDTDVPIEEAITPTPSKSGKMAAWIIAGVIAAAMLYVFISMFGLGLGSFAAPRPGLWPFIVAVAILIALPLALRDKAIPESFEISKMWRPLLTGAALIGVIVLYAPLGFILSTGLATLIVTRYVCGETWKASAVVAIATPVAAYLLFGLAFGVALDPLPTWL